MKIVKEVISPIVAREILKKNINNRNVNEAKVFNYAKDMTSGNWLSNTGELIKISKSGVVLDGQHRLYAIIKAGMSIELHVAYELEDTIFKVIDTGKVRNASDVLQIGGVPNTRHVVSICTLVSYYQSTLGSASRATNTSRLTTSALFDFYEKRADYYQSVIRESVSLYTKFQKILSVSEIGFFMCILDSINISKSREFLRQICEGVDVSNNVIILLRNKLIADKVNNQKKLTVQMKRAFIIKTWNSFYLNNSVKILKYAPESEDYPSIVGYIK